MTTSLPADQMQRLASRLREAGAVLPCPRCGHTEVNLVDGYFLEHRQTQLRNLVISGDNRYPTAAVMCARCGFMAQHALDILDPPG